MIRVKKKISDDDVDRLMAASFLVDSHKNIVDGILTMGDVDINEERFLDSLNMSPFLFSEESEQSENLNSDIGGYLKDENSLFSEENFMFRRFW